MCQNVSDLGLDSLDPSLNDLEISLEDLVHHPSYSHTPEFDYYFTQRKYFLLKSVTGNKVLFFSSILFEKNAELHREGKIFDFSNLCATLCILF